MSAGVTTRIRPALPEDAPGLARAHVATWQAGYAGQMPAEYLDGLTNQLPDRVERWRERLERADSTVTTLIAERLGGSTGGEILGVVSYGRARDQDVPAGIGEVWAVDLAPSAWGHGVGAALLDAVVDGLSRDYRRAYLWVLEANARARRFYEKHGWTCDGRVKVDELRGFPLRELSYSRSLRS